MQAGDLIHRIVFQRPIETKVNGALKITYGTDSPPDMVFAKVVSQKGGEAIEAARVNAREGVRVCIYWRSDVSTKWRFTWKGREYYLKAVDQTQELDGWLWFTAECSNVP